MDELDSAGDQLLTVSSQKLPAGMSDADWFSQYLADVPPHPECFPPRTLWQPLSVDGIAGGLHGGLPSCNFTEAVVISHGRAYVFTAAPSRFPGTQAVFPRSLFDALLASVQLDPAAAR